MFLPRISFTVAVAALLWVSISALSPLRGADPLAAHGDESSSDLQSVQKLFKVRMGIDLEQYGNALYFFPATEIKATWDEAKRVCESFNLNMLFIDADEEYDWILQALYSKKRWDVHHWTSGKKESGKWIWDATKEDIKNIRWHTGYSGIGDVCMGVGAWSAEHHQANLFDYGCKNQYSIICKVM